LIYQGFPFVAVTVESAGVDEVIPPVSKSVTQVLLDGTTVPPALAATTETVTEPIKVPEVAYVMSVPWILVNAALWYAETV